MIRDNITKIQARIEEAARRIGRDPGEITLVCVTKNRSREQIREAVAAGVTHLGENRVQEAREKWAQLRDLPVSWHCVGHLQRNKTRRAVEIFDYIHSVDSLALGSEIERSAALFAKKVGIFMQVNVAGEETKYGIVPEQVPELCGHLIAFEHVQVLGLMTIAPFSPQAEESRPVFRQTRLLLEGLRRTYPRYPYLNTLSMGMSQDFEVAVEEGAHMVRIGTSVFEGGEER